MKKFISIVLSLTLILSLATVFPAFATIPILYAKDTVLKVTVTMPNVDSEITAIDGYLSYSKELTPKENSFETPHFSDMRSYTEANGDEYLLKFNTTSLINYDIRPDNTLCSIIFTVNEDIALLPFSATIVDVCYVNGTTFYDVPKDCEYTVTMIYDPIEPTTDAPTTAEPTTEEPTTEEPTSEPVTEPSTEAPSTEAPTTAPVTDEPTTEAPTTGDPTTEAPTTAEPTTEAPTTAEPTTEAPTTAEPTTEAPTTAEPTTEAPTTAEPTTEAPTTAEPTTEAPTTAEPTTVAPTTAEPTTEAPTTQPTTTQPATKKPSLTYTKKSIAAAGKFTLSVKNKGTAKTTYSTSNKKVATVTSKGVVTGLQRGAVTITVKVGTTKLTCKVVVTNNPVAKIGGKSVSSSKTYKIKKGKTLTVKLYRRVAAIKNVVTTSNKKVAKITSKANADKVTVKGIKIGKATIKIKINGVRTFTVKVKVVKNNITNSQG